METFKRKRTRDELISSIENNMSKFILKNAKENLKKTVDVKNEVLESIRIINTTSKTLTMQKIVALKEKDRYTADKLNSEITHLYKIKHRILSKIINDYDIEPIGYHIKKDNLKPIPLYVINDHEFHFLHEIDDKQLKNIPFLGIFNTNVKKEADFNREELNKAISLLNKL